MLVILVAASFLTPRSVASAPVPSSAISGCVGSVGSVGGGITPDSTVSSAAVVPAPLSSSLTQKAGRRMCLSLLLPRRKLMVTGLHQHRLRH